MMFNNIRDTGYDYKINILQIMFTNNCIYKNEIARFYEISFTVHTANIPKHTYK